MLQKFNQTHEALLATALPEAGEDRFALLDACSLDSGYTRDLRIAEWNKNLAEVKITNAYQVGRKFANLKVEAERDTTNSDGSARREVDVSYDEVFTDGTTQRSSLVTLVAGSSHGSCATPQDAPELRILGNRQVVGTSVRARNAFWSDYAIGTRDGMPLSFQQRREARFIVTDPAGKATYAVLRWAASGGAEMSLKLLSPRLARDAAEMQGKSGNAQYKDSDAFRACRSTADNTVANAATADCIGLGVGGNVWGTSLNEPRNPPQTPAARDTIFDGLGLKAGARFTIEVYADDGWKTIDGQKGQTPIATYTTTLRRTPLTFAQMMEGFYDGYPQLIAGTSKFPLQIAEDFRGQGGQMDVVWSVPKLPAGTPTMAPSNLYSMTQGPKANAVGPQERNGPLYAPLAANATSASMPIASKPEGASTTSYAEFALSYSDRGGAEILLGFRFQ